MMEQGKVRLLVSWSVHGRTAMLAKKQLDVWEGWRVGDEAGTAEFVCMV